MKNKIKRTMTKTKFKFKVNIIESEAGWGSKIDDVEEYDTYEKAVDRITKFNAQNTEKTTPSWYMRAEAANFTIQPKK